MRGLFDENTETKVNLQAFIQNSSSITPLLILTSITINCLLNDCYNEDAQVREPKVALNVQ